MLCYNECHNMITKQLYNKSRNICAFVKPGIEIGSATPVIIMN